MVQTHQEWLHLVGQLLALAALLAGVLLLLRLFWRWRRGTLALATGASVARLQARPWQPTDAVLLLLAILLPMTPALLAMLRPSDHTARPPTRAPQFVPYLLYYALLLAGVLVAARRTGLGIGAALGITRETRWPSVRTGLVLGFAMLPPVILTAWLADGLLRWLGLPPSQQAVFTTLADPSLGTAAQALLIFVAVVVAPLAEEAVFRGVVFPALLHSGRLFRALLLVNVLFALLHLHLPSCLPLLAVGLSLSFGMLATGSLLTPAIMHAIFNGEMLLIFYLWPALPS